MAADRPHEAGYQVMVRALKFRCATVPAVRAHAVWLWGATRTGQVDMYKEHRAREGVTPESLRIESQAGEEVRAVLATSPAAQRDWIRKSLDSCAGSTS